MIKVLFIIHESSMGGATHSLLDMMDELKNRIFPIFISLDDGMVEEMLKVKGYKYYRIPRINEWGYKNAVTNERNRESFISNYEAACSISKIIIQEKCSLVYSNSSVSNAGIIAAFIAHVPHIWHIREFMEEDFGWEYANMDMKRKLFNVNDQFISISRAIQKSFLEKYNTESTQIYDGVKIFDRNLNKKNKNYNLFLHVGTLTEGKGIWQSLNAVKKLVDDGGNSFKIYFVGNSTPEIISDMKRFISENNLEKIAKILPYQKDLSEYEEEADFVLVPSKMEGLGRVTIEAMEYGNIVIGANSGATPELIGIDESRGYLFEAGNYRSLAKVMQIAIDEKFTKGKEKKVNAKKFCLDTFNIERYADRIYKIIYSTIESWNEYGVNKIEKRKDVFSEILDIYVNYKREEFSLNSFTNKSVQFKVNYWEIWNSCIENDPLFIERKLELNKFMNVAIYGLGKYGRRLIDELYGTKISVSCVIDNFTKEKFFRDCIPVYTQEEFLLSQEKNLIDLVIIAIVKDGMDYSIMNNLEEKYVGKVILIRNLLA